VIKQLLSVGGQVNDRLRRLPLIQDALAGRLDQQHYVRYLTEIANQYVPHSPKVMCLAASRCVNTHPELAESL